MKNIELKEIKVFSVSNTVENISISNNVDYIMLSNDNYIELINTNTKKVIYRDEYDMRFCNSGIVSHNNNFYILIDNKLNEIKVVNLNNSKEDKINLGFNYLQSDITLSPDSSFFVTYCRYGIEDEDGFFTGGKDNDTRIMIYSCENFKILNEIYIEALEEPVAINPKNILHLLTRINQTLNIYNVQTSDLYKLFKNIERFYKVLYSNDGKRIITVDSANENNFINIYDVESGELTKKITVNDFNLKTQQRDDTGEHYLVDNVEWETTIPPDKIYLTPNDKYLIMGTYHGITFIDIEEVKIVKYISNCSTGIFACSQDGKYIVFEENSSNNYEPILKLYEIIYK